MADCDDETLIWLSSSLTIGIVTAVESKTVKITMKNASELIGSYRM